MEFEVFCDYLDYATENVGVIRLLFYEKVEN